MQTSKWQEMEAPYLLLGNWAIVAFLLAQALDGVLTYWGVLEFGHEFELNPNIAVLMAHIGSGPALFAAKAYVSMLGVLLHLLHVHVTVSAMFLYYLYFALLPWRHAFFG